MDYIDALELYNKRTLNRPFEKAIEYDSLYVFICNEFGGSVTIFKNGNMKGFHPADIPPGEEIINEYEY